MRRLSLRWRLTLVYVLVSLLMTSVLLAGIYALVRASQDGVGEPTARDVAASAEAEVDELLDDATPREENAVEDVVVDVHDDAVDDTLAKLLVWSLTGLAVTVAVTVLAGWLFAGRALRPVHTITQRARAISAASLDERIDLEGPQDELTELADTFDSMLARIESAFALERRLVATMSHELRTPLANQQAALDLVLVDPEATADELREAAELALAQSERANRTIEALLMLARAEAGQRPLRRVPVCLGQLVQERVEALAETRDDLEWRVDLASVEAHLQPDLIRRLVANLLENAVAYNLSGGYVEVSVAAIPRGAVLTVSNPGALISPEAAGQLVMPFRRGAADRTARDGVGLGLSIVESIVRHHDGDLTLVPRPAGGLTVTVMLPAH